MLAHTPPTSWAYDASGLFDYAYDPATAEQLLEQDGWSTGPDGIRQKGDQRLEFALLTNAGNKTRETLIQIAAEQYKQIGVSVHPQTESFEALTARTDHSKDATYGDRGGRDIDAWVSGWALGADPDSYAIWHSSSIQGAFNDVGYKSPDVDKALVDGRTQCTDAARKVAYSELNKQLNQDQPYNFGYSANFLVAANSKVQGIKPGSFVRNSSAPYAQWNIDTWWLKQ
jgi:peptide/nickel transport system substrate-binding protein